MAFHGCLSQGQDKCEDSTHSYVAGLKADELRLLTIPKLPSFLSVFMEKISLCG